MTRRRGGESKNKKIKNKNKKGERKERDVPSVDIIDVNYYRMYFSTLLWCEKDKSMKVEISFLCNMHKQKGKGKSIATMLTCNSTKEIFLQVC